MNKDQQNASDLGVKHQVWRHRGCGLCNNPANYMCNQCRAEVNEQGTERTIHGTERVVPNIGNSLSSDGNDVKRSIIGNVVPEEFIYV